jgi:hypothetical protein
MSHARAKETPLSCEGAGRDPIQPPPPPTTPVPITCVLEYRVYVNGEIACVQEEPFRWTRASFLLGQSFVQAVGPLKSLVQGAGTVQACRRADFSS